MTTTIDDGGPVHPVRTPVPGAIHANGDPAPTELHTGMSLRDYFAAHAPIGMENAALHLVNNTSNDNPTFQDGIKTLAAMRYLYADAMLRARQENSEGGA